jgi:hypothetical protein
MTVDKIIADKITVDKLTVDEMIVGQMIFGPLLSQQRDTINLVFHLTNNQYDFLAAAAFNHSCITSD